MSTCRWCAEWRGNYCSHQNRRHRCGSHFGGNLSRSCPAPSRNAVMGRLWHRALPLLPHQLNLPRTWGGISTWFALAHPFSGSDATSQFSGKGNKSAWKAWKTYPAATAGFTSASQDGCVPLEFTSAAFRLTGRFTCIVYYSTTRWMVFGKKLVSGEIAWSLSQMQPTLKALDGHGKASDVVQSRHLYQLLL